METRTTTSTPTSASRATTLASGPVTLGVKPGTATTDRCSTSTKTWPWTELKSSDNVVALTNPPPMAAGRDPSTETRVPGPRTCELTVSASMPTSVENTSASSPVPTTTVSVVARDTATSSAVTTSRTQALFPLRLMAPDGTASP